MYAILEATPTQGACCRTAYFSSANSGIVRNSFVGTVRVLISRSTGFNGNVVGEGLCMHRDFVAEDMVDIVL